MRKAKQKLYIRGTNTRSASFFTHFRELLRKGGGTNAEGYVAIFTKASSLKPAEYQFGERRVML